MIFGSKVTFWMIFGGSNVSFSHANHLILISGQCFDIALISPSWNSSNKKCGFCNHHVLIQSKYLYFQSIQFSRKSCKTVYYLSKLRVMSCKTVSITTYQGRGYDALWDRVSQGLWLLVTAKGLEGIDTPGLALEKFAADISCFLEICSSISSSRATLIDGVFLKVWTKAAYGVCDNVLWAVSFHLFARSHVYCWSLACSACSMA